MAKRLISAAIDPALDCFTRFYLWEKHVFFRVTSTVKHYPDIASDIPSGSTYGIFILTIWHTFWHIFWHSMWHSIWHLLWRTFWHIFWHSLWHSICYIFEDSLWSRSGGEHSDLGLAVQVRQGPLWSRACSWGPAEEKEASWHKIS